MKQLTLGIILTLLLAPLYTAIADGIPDCLSDGGAAIGIDDGEVLNWEKTTPNQFLARAHVQGSLVKLLPNQTGHNHFLIQIGPDSDNLLEVIYDIEFGKLPHLNVGMNIEGCGDYITSNAQAGPYPPSPAGAIIHWVHSSDTPHKHPSGFLAIDGTVYGN